MPAILTHYTFALETLDNRSRVFEDVIRLGNQGPDVFMAYGTVPWRKRPDKKTINPVGAKMHHAKLYEVYGAMIDYALASPDREMLLAYIEASYAHYALDRLAHAYIFYRSGFDENGELHGFYKWSHGTFEALLDLALSKRKKTRISPYKCLLCDESRVKAISKMWANCTNFGLNEDHFYLAYLDYVGGMKLIQSKTGWKRPLLRLVMGKTSAAHAQSMPGRLGKYKALDVENLSHMEWRDPSTGETHTSSIDDLFALAHRDMKDLHELMNAARNGLNVKGELKKWERSLDHDGTPYGDVKRYQELCWKQR